MYFWYFILYSVPHFFLLFSAPCMFFMYVCTLSHYCECGVDIHVCSVDYCIINISIIEKMVLVY